MKIRVVSAWRQDRSLEDRERDYLKRLTRYTSVEIDETKGVKGDDREAVRREGQKLTSRIKKGSFLVALTERGKTFDSVDFSKWIEEMALGGRSDITFVIGGSAGLDEALIEKADMKLSLSPMTFPHQLTRVILLEQIYRAFTIIKSEPYHK